MGAEADGTKQSSGNNSGSGGGAQPKELSIPPTRKLLEPFDDTEAAFKQAAGPVPRIAIVSHLESQAKDIGERVAAYWNCELIEPVSLLQAAVKDGKAELKRRKKTEAKRRRKAAKRAQKEAQEGEAGGEAQGGQGADDKHDTDGVGGGDDEEDDDDDDEEGKEREEEEEGEVPQDAKGRPIWQTSSFGTEEAEEEEEGEEAFDEFEDEEKNEDERRRAALYQYTPRATEPGTDIAVEIAETLLSGQPVKPPQLLQLMAARASCDRAQFKGYVVVVNAGNPEAAKEQLRRMRNWEFQPNFAFYLNQNDEDADAQAATLVQDFRTGALHTRPFNVPEEDEVDGASGNADTERDEEAGESDGEEEEEEDDDDAGEEEGAAALTAPRDQAMPPLPGPSSETLGVYCVRRPVDVVAPAASGKRRTSTEARSHWMHALHGLQPQHTVTINGLSPLHSLINAISSFLREHGLMPTLDPLALRPDDTEFSSDAEMFEVLSTLELYDDAMGPEESELGSWTWQPGPFGPYCPVTLHKTGALKHGRAQFAAVFQGRLYMLASKAAREHFLVNPRAYVRRPSELPCRAVLASSDMVGLTALAEAFQMSHPQSAYMGIFNLDQQLPADDAADEQKKEAFDDMVGSLENLKYYVAVVSLDNLETAIQALVNTAAAPHAVGVMRPPPRPAVPEIVVPGDSDDEEEVSIPNAVATDPRAQAVDGAVKTLRQKGVVAYTISHIENVQDPKDVSSGVLAEMHFHANMIFKPFPRQTMDMETMLGEEESVSFNLGDTGRFCPVTLEREHVLAPGSPEFAARYEGRVYRFANDTSRTEFQLAPYQYVRTTEPMAVPPPRLCFVGPSGSGKSLFARRIAKEHGVHLVDFPELVRSAAWDPSHPVHEQAKEHVDNPEEADFSADHAVATIRMLWKEEPYASKGFILENFPRNDEDLRAATEASLYPDAVLNFSLTAHVAARRLLDSAMKAFVEKRDAIIAERKALRERREQEGQRRREAFMQEQAKKRKDFEENLRQRREAGEDVDDEEFEEEEYQSEGEEEEQEQEQEQEQEPLESDAEARDRIRNELVDVHERVAEAAQAAADAARDEFRISSHTVNSDFGMSRVFSVLLRRLRPLLQDRNAAFDYCFATGLSLAEQLLDKGVCCLSVFGLWDPVDVYHCRAAATVVQPRHAAVYRNRVYYFASEKNREAFVQKPRQFLAQHPQVVPPLFPSTRLALFVVGPPKTGKSTLCQRLAAHYHVPLLSVASIVEDVLSSHPNAALTKQIKDVLSMGKTLPQDLLAEAAQLAFISPQCCPRGFVFDAEGLAKDVLQQWVKADMHVFAALELTASVELSLKRNRRLRDGALQTMPQHDSDKIVRAQFDAYMEVTAPARVLCVEEYRNWYEIPAERNKWGQFYAAQALCDCVLQAQGAHRILKEKGQPAPLHRMCTPTSSIEGSLSAKFGRYCPVRWVDRRELVQTPFDLMRFSAEYSGEIFKLAGKEELDSFIASPGKYADAEPPAHLPEFVDEASVKLLFPQSMAFGGFCPVTYVESDCDPEAITPGLVQFVVKFKDSFYAMASKEAREAFMRTPHRFADVPLPDKVPRHVSPVNVTSLPMLAYMKYTVAQTITKAMTAVGLKRPKYPFLTRKQSALTYVATYLKAHNKDASQFSRQKWQQKLRKFEERSHLLLYLGKTLKPRFDMDHPIDLHHKLGQFFALQPASQSSRPQSAAATATTTTPAAAASATTTALVPNTTATPRTADLTTAIAPPATTASSFC